MGTLRAARGLRKLLAERPINGGGSSGDVLRSAILSDSIVSQWNNEVRQWPPSRRESWLKRQEVICGLGARRCAELRRTIVAAHDEQTLIVPSEPWLAAFDHEGRKMPSQIEAHQRDGRRFSVRMRLSRCETRFGDEGLPHRRFTPPQAVGLEDDLDEMGVEESRFYVRPPSPSAEAIRRIRQLGAKECRGRRPAFARQYTIAVTPQHATQSQRIDLVSYRERGR